MTRSLRQAVQLVVASSAASVAGCFSFQACCSETGKSAGMTNAKMDLMVCSQQMQAMKSYMNMLLMPQYGINDQINIFDTYPWTFQAADGKMKQNQAMLNGNLFYMISKHKAAEELKVPDAIRELVVEIDNPEFLDDKVMTAHLPQGSNNGLKVAPKIYVIEEDPEKLRQLNVQLAGNNPLFGQNGLYVKLIDMYADVIELYSYVRTSRGNSPTDPEIAKFVGEFEKKFLVYQDGFKDGEKDSEYFKFVDTAFKVNEAPWNKTAEYETPSTIPCFPKEKQTVTLGGQMRGIANIVQIKVQEAAPVAYVDAADYLLSKNKNDSNVDKAIYNKMKAQDPRGCGICGILTQCSALLACGAGTTGILLWAVKPPEVLEELSAEVEMGGELGEETDTPKEPKKHHEKKIGAVSYALIAGILLLLGVAVCVKVARRRPRTPPSSRQPPASSAPRSGQPASGAQVLV